MAYERNTTEGIRTWLETEVNTSGWNASSIAKGLTEDVMTIISHNFSEFDARIKQGLLLSTLCMRKGDIMLFSNDLTKMVEVSLNDTDDFVKTIAHVLQTYPTSQQLDIKMDAWSSPFNTLLTTLGSKITEKGLHFHPPEDAILQHNARQQPSHVSSNYMDYKPTHTQHFTLTTNQQDILSAEARHARFKELVETEERSEQAVAQKRAGTELSSMAKRIASPTSNVQNPFPLPVSPSTNVRPGIPASRSLSGGSLQPNPSLFNKRPVRPNRPPPSGGAAGGGGLFINKSKPAGHPKPVQRPPTLNANNLPRGLQRVQKTQMLDFNAATEFEQNTANAIKKAQDDIKAQQEAKKQEALEKKRKVAEEKREKEEAKKAQRVAAALAREAAREAKVLAKEAHQDVTRSPTSIPTSPKTPTSPLSPTLKHEHVFAIPSLPNQEEEENDQDQSRNEKLTTF